MTMTGYSTTPRQAAFIRNLRAERGIEDERMPFDGDAASLLITQLLATPRPIRAEAAPAFVPAGKQYFLHDGAVYRTQESKAGRVYAKRLVIPTGDHKRATWDYDSGAIYRLQENEQLTIEQAARLGHLHGFCVVCGARLDDPESVQRGIGPVCVKRIAS